VTDGALAARRRKQRGAAAVSVPPPFSFANRASPKMSGAYIPARAAFGESRAAVFALGVGGFVGHAQTPAVMVAVIAVPAGVEAPEAAGNRHVDVDLVNRRARVVGAEPRIGGERGGGQRHERYGGGGELLHRVGLLIELRRRARAPRDGSVCSPASAYGPMEFAQFAHGLYRRTDDSRQTFAEAGRRARRLAALAISGTSARQGRRSADAAPA